MIDQNETDVDPGPPRRGVYPDWWRATAAALLAVALALFGGGTAHAGNPLGSIPAEDAPAANAAFTHKGVPIYGHLAVGSTCQLLGFCGGAADSLRGERPKFLSAEGGQEIAVDCQEGGATRVWGFFEGGDEVQQGWVTRGVQMRFGAGPVRGC